MIEEKEEAVIEEEEETEVKTEELELPQTEQPEVQEEDPYKEYNGEDWRGDVGKWMTANAHELSVIQEKVGNLVITFDSVENFVESMNLLSSKNDLSITFLDKIPKVVEGEAEWKVELSAWKEINDTELVMWEKKIRSLMEAHDFADDFLSGLQRFRPKNDLSIAMIEFLIVYIEKGLEPVKTEKTE